MRRWADFDESLMEVDVAGCGAAAVEPRSQIAGQCSLRNGLAERVSKLRRAHHVLGLCESQSHVKEEIANLPLVKFSSGVIRRISQRILKSNLGNRSLNLNDYLSCFTEPHSVANIIS
jgi:hypothetical protein